MIRMALIGSKHHEHKGVIIHDKSSRQQEETEAKDCSVSVWRKYKTNDMSLVVGSWVDHASVSGCTVAET